LCRHIQWKKGKIPALVGCTFVPASFPLIPRSTHGSSEETFDGPKTQVNMEISSVFMPFSSYLSELKDL